jgi:hypothetical protein
MSPLSQKIRRQKNEPVRIGCTILIVPERGPTIDYVFGLGYCLGHGSQVGESCAKTGWEVQAFCLMSNHFHLVMETPQPNLVAGMK